MIGKKGDTMKKLQGRHGVQVWFEESETDDDTQIVVISGDVASNVAAAARALDFVSETRAIPVEMAGWFCGKDGQYIKLFKELSGVADVSLSGGDGNRGKHKPGDEFDSENLPGKAERCWLTLTGQRTTVAHAALCVETHMSYFCVFDEINRSEDLLNKRITELQECAGWRPSKGRGRGYTPQNESRRSRGEFGKDYKV